MKPPAQESDIKLDNLTRDDLKKIEKSMKRPEFMGLLNEYMVEISDPKNKNEYDEYLRQLEREKELPKHMKIVEIRPKFCFRTFIVSQKNKKHEMKFFVNMCESEYLDKPSCEPGPGHDGKVGYNWKIPNSMGKIRYDQDKKGDPCQVVDIAFHPDTFMFAIKKQFQEMIINIALEAAQRQLGERKETLSRDYVILKNVICKGADSKPALMPIRYIEGRMYNKGEGPNNEFERDMEGRETKLQKQINKQKEEYDKEKQKDKPKPSQEEQAKEQQVEEGEKLVVDMEKGVQQPKYSTIYTYPVDYSEFIDSPYTAKKKVPSAFNIQFAIPRVESMQEVAGQQLEINDKKIVLKIGEKYFIDLEFEQLKVKYTLVTANAKAKYDKKKKALRIVIPVDQSVTYESEKEPERSEESKEQVVEDETWKTKVLEFTQPNVSVKMLENAEKEEQEKPKLVEQIDDEDIIQEPKPQQTVPSVTQDDEIQEETSKVPEKKFTLSNYYGKPKQQPANQESSKIGFLFQETSDKVVLVLQMKNYKQQQVKYLNVLNRQLLVIWDQSQKGQADATAIRYQHLRLAEGISNKVDKVQFVFRVGFLAIMVQKKPEEKGKYWQKESIQAVKYEAETQQSQLSAFKGYFVQEQQAQLQRERSQQQQQIENKELQGEKSASTDVISTKDHEPETESKTVAAVNNIESNVREVQTVGDQVRREETLQAASSQGVLLRGLQPQFIAFDAPFIEVLE